MRFGNQSCLIITRPVRNGPMHIQDTVIGDNRVIRVDPHPLAGVLIEKSCL